MLAKITSKNQLTLPKAIVKEFPGTDYFDVQAKRGASYSRRCECKSWSPSGKKSNHWALRKRTSTPQYNGRADEVSDRANSCSNRHKRCSIRDRVSRGSNRRDAQHVRHDPYASSFIRYVSRTRTRFDLPKNWIKRRATKDHANLLHGARRNLAPIRALEANYPNAVTQKTKCFCA